jgi:autotransporter-associated beta strand protein
MQSRINMYAIVSLKLRRLMLAGAVLVAIVLSHSEVRGDVIYRETFGRPNSATGNINPTNFFWALFTNRAAHTDAYGVSPNTGRPTGVANVNAGPNVDGSFTAYAIGNCYVDTTVTLLNNFFFTPEYSFDPANYAAGSIVFSWYEGNASTVNTYQVAVRIGGIWYVSAQSFANTVAVSSGGNFGTGAQLMSLTYNATAANWKVLNFNGNYVTNSGGLFTNSSVAVSVGATASSDLSGPITAFGLFGQLNGASATMRFDSFTINATPASPAGKNVTWVGNVNANWNTNTFNWTSSAVATNYADGDVVLFNDTASVSTVNLATNVLPASVTVSNNTLAYALSGNGGIGGTGGLTKQGTNTLTLGGTNAYSGATTIGNGTLLINGRNTGTGSVSVNTNATLGGTGTIAGAVTVQAGGNLVPGAGGGAAAVLTLSNSLTLASGSFTTLRVQTGGIKDQVVSGGAITYGGTLTVTNVGGPLAAGDTFKLFTAASYPGSFATSNLPALTGNLIWVNTLSSDGTLAVAAPAAAVVTNLPATGVQGTFATLNGQVVSIGSQTPTVTLYYGPADGGANAVAWSNSVALGSQSGSFSYTATGLSTNTTYYYAARATNSAGVTWAAPSRSFTTLAADPTSTPTLVQYLSGTDKDNTVTWQFKISTGRKAGTATTIPVPSCWELMGFGTYQYGGSSDGEIGYYTNTFSVPSAWAGKEIFLVFEGVFTDTSASINGQSVGPTHQGGFYEFKYDVTPYIVAGASTNVLRVTVNKWSSSTSIQNAEQQGVDYWDFGGIYRPVYLEAKPAAYIDYMAANPLANGNITNTVHLGGITTSYTVQSFVTDANNVMLGYVFSNSVSAGASNVVLSASLPTPNAWSAETPTLYNLIVQLVAANGVVVHSVTNQIGFRTITFVANQGFFVNGKKVVMRGICHHEEWPTTGRTSSAAQNSNDVAMIKDMNFNAIRESHYPQNKTFLQECDRQGLYVLEELDSYQHGGSALNVVTGPPLIFEMIRRDVNHPCIIAWDNGNEGGANGDLDGGNSGATNYFDLYDVQNRLVIRPQQGSAVFNGVITDHYEYYNTITNYLRPGAPNVFMPTEMLHALYDGGGGACLQEYWDVFRTAANSGGMFLWSWDDEGIVHDDTGVMDVSGSSGPDGIVGPFREKEASYYTYKEIYSPVQIGTPNPATFTGTLAVSNRFDFTDLTNCTFDWQLGQFPGATDATNNFSTNALTGGFLVALDSGSFSGPALPPGSGMGSSGSLALPAFPANWTNYDALRFTATDPFGRNIYTWTWPLRSQAQIAAHIIGATPVGAPAISAGTTASEIIVTNGPRVIHFSKTTGVITSLTVSNQAVSLANGPRPVSGSWSVTSITNYFDGTNYIILINDITSAANGFQWSLRPDGWLNLKYRYTMTGLQDTIGVTFDYPSNKVSRMNWLGQGPYRVWKNRLAGQEVFVHTKAINNTWTGHASGTQWVYPEFAGFHGQLYWAGVQTTEQPITIVTPTANLFLRVLSPPATEIGYENPVFPAGGISLLHGISAIGTKWVYGSDMGPSGLTNVATGLYTGEASFFFGPPPTTSTGTVTTTVGLNASSNPSTYGNPVTFTATVRTNGVAVGGISGETVSFYDGAVLLGTGTLNGNGQAAYATLATQLSAGACSITAAYIGDATYLGSTSLPALSQTVNPATLTVTNLVALNKVYDGTTNATLNATNAGLSGMLNGDSVTLVTSSAAGYFANADVGANKAVTVTGCASAGADAGNYTLVQPAGLTANILALVTPSFAAQPIFMGSGGWHLSFTAQAGQKYKVLAAENVALPLGVWTMLTNGTFGSGPVTFTDSSTNLPVRFYRIVSP